MPDLLFIVYQQPKTLMCRVLQVNKESREAGSSKMAKINFKFGENNFLYSGINPIFADTRLT